MLRRVSTFNVRCTHHTSFAASQLLYSQRFIRGAAGSASSQYYPLHSFQSFVTTTTTTDAPTNSSSNDQQHRDVSFSEFKAMISNPGPLRVVYSDDYLDWYYRAFKEKLAYDRSRRLAAAKNIQPFASSSGAGPSSSTAALKPTESPSRQLGERVMGAAQRGIERASIQHGLLDLYERAPQFPQVHIDRARDEHLPMLLDEFVLRGEVSAADVWRRALIARAMLLHNRRSYPSSFDYIFMVIDECVFAKPLGLSPPPPSAAAGADQPEGKSSSSSDDKKSSSNSGSSDKDKDIAPELLDDSSLKRFPSLALARYYEYLVKKYNVQNAAEAHILLRCHLAPDAETLLFSNPPPEEEKDSSKVGGGPDWQRALALPLPPVDCLISAPKTEPGNSALAKVLLFAELNCNAGSNVDPFHKFPKAQGAVTRPSPQEAREEHERTGLESKLRHRRHHILPALIQFTINTIDVRGRDVNRLARQSESSDMNWATNSAVAQERGAGGANDGTIAGTVFNHRAIRAEARDAANRRIIGGLKQYRHGRENLASRPTLLSGEEHCRFGVAGAFNIAGNCDGASVSLATDTVLNPYLKASLPRFVAQVEADKHIQLVLSLLPTTTTTVGSSSNQSNSSNAVARKRGSKVQRLVHDYARQLLKLALEFHLPKNRAVQLRATKVAAALLDTAVVDALEVIKLQQRELDAEVRAAKTKALSSNNKKTEKDANDSSSSDEANGASSSSSSSAAAAATVVDPMVMLSSSLGGGAMGQVLAERYVPFAERALDQHGFPTEAKYSDHARWMGVDV